jgi:hypothetical protein
MNGKMLGINLILFDFTIRFYGYVSKIFKKKDIDVVFCGNVAFPIILL